MPTTASGHSSFVIRHSSFVIALVLLPGCETSGPEAKDAPRVITTQSGIEMVLIPGGRFQMGSDDEDEIDETRHEVCVSSFYMDKYEVTQREYQKLMGENPSRWKGDDHPVEQMRWAKAAEYCNARSRAEGLPPAYDLKTWECDFEAGGYRLPTEAEWEYACRAGTDTRRFFGNSADKLSRYAWFKESSSRSHHPVGRKPPNPWGLCDMYGNVWEWCNDHYKEEYYQESPDKDPRGPASGTTRVVRGGAWLSRPDKCRSAYRSSEDPGYADACFGRDRQGFYGFRCVRRPLSE